MPLSPAQAHTYSLLQFPTMTDPISKKESLIVHQIYALHRIYPMAFSNSKCICIIVVNTY